MTALSILLFTCKCAVRGLAVRMRRFSCFIVLVTTLLSKSLKTACRGLKRRMLKMWKTQWKMWKKKK